MEKDKKNTGVLVGLLIGIIIMLVVFIALFATGTIEFKTNTTGDEQTSNNNQEEDDSDTESSTDYCGEIEGNYCFDEVISNGGDVNGVTSPSYEYKLSVSKEENNCNATLEINGFQTYNKIKLDVQYKDNQYQFMFNTYADGDVASSGNAGTYNKGDFLFSLYDNNNELYTHWEKYLPQAQQNKKDGVHFKKQ